MRRRRKANTILSYEGPASVCSDGFAHAEEGGAGSKGHVIP